MGLWSSFWGVPQNKEEAEEQIEKVRTEIGSLTSLLRRGSIIALLAASSWSGMVQAKTVPGVRAPSITVLQEDKIADLIDLIEKIENDETYELNDLADYAETATELAKNMDAISKRIRDLVNEQQHEKAVELIERLDDAVEKMHRNAAHTAAQMGQEAPKALLTVVKLLKEVHDDLMYERDVVKRMEAGQQKTAAETENKVEQLREVMQHIGGEFRRDGDTVVLVLTEKSRTLQTAKEKTDRNVRKLQEAFGFSTRDEGVEQKSQTREVSSMYEWETELTIPLRVLE